MFLFALNRRGRTPRKRTATGSREYEPVEVRSQRLINTQHPEHNKSIQILMTLELTGDFSLRFQHRGSKWPSVSNHVRNTVLWSVHTDCASSLCTWMVLHLGFWDQKLRKVTSIQPIGLWTPNFLSFNFKGVLSPLSRFFTGYFHLLFINVVGITACSKLLNFHKIWV